MNIISTDLLLLSLFVLNALLILIDASLGYHFAPSLLRMSNPDEPELQEITIKNVRRMLTLLVALYMFFNCMGFFRGSDGLLVIVTVMILFDLGAQFYLRRRSGREGEQP